ncbi:hypothetical protein FTUN_2237 [Frigoriglobus tundricola]|uniref:Uncharacterized protein n=1 Tax=Frigoriglobus tundricola TaxID=2774151 RepID=A0A6M5YLA9_9BACT|nr:hypothetical protein FTUN_2237 [Frigoriglobus tundricola]
MDCTDARRCRGLRRTTKVTQLRGCASLPNPALHTDPAK